MLWNRLTEASKCLSDRSRRARAVRELWSRRCCWKSRASAGDKKSAVDRLRASERGHWVSVITAESRTRAVSPYPPSNTACILVRTRLHLRTLAASRWSPRAARHLSLHTHRLAIRSPLQAAPPTVSCAGRRGRRTHAGRSSVVRCRAQCPVPGAQCPVLPGVRCSMPSAVCPVPCDQCPMCPNAQCPIDCSPVRCSAVRVRAPVTPTSARRPICATAERALQPLDCHCLPRV